MLFRSERRKQIVAGEGWSPEFWREFAGMGLLAAPFAEAQGLLTDDDVFKALS